MKSNTIYERIIAKGAGDSQIILNEGKRKAEDIVSRAIEETNLAISAEREIFNARIDELYKTKITEFKQTTRQGSLLHKKQIIDEVFKEALLELTKISDEDLFKQVLLFLDKTSLNGTHLIRVNQKDYPRYQKLFSSKGDHNLDKLVKDDMRDVSFILDQKTANISGGFMVIGAAFDIDYSYDAVLEREYNQLESQIAKILFDEEVK